jgi:hypothetical protein
MEPGLPISSAYLFRILAIVDDFTRRPSLQKGAALDEFT